MAAIGRSLAVALVVGVLLCAPLALAVEPTDWQGYRSSIRALSSGQANGTVAAKLPGLMGWEFELPMQYMRQVSEQSTRETTVCYHQAKASLQLLPWPLCIATALAV